MEWPTDIELSKDLMSNALVSGDKGKLRRVVLNLVANAQQALQEVSQADKRVLVKTRKVDNDVEITIEDNGPGIPDDLHEKIYEPLFSTKNFGVGLGMTIVKEIIEMHKGSVTHQAAHKRGCRFVVRIPLCKGQ
jgi:signal transduction histidine kinase